jgi:hypothetical protein
MQKGYCEEAIRVLENILNFNLFCEDIWFICLRFEVSKRSFKINVTSLL